MEKQQQSKVNVLEARLQQLKTSPLYTDEARVPLIAKIEAELKELATINKHDTP